MARKRVVGNPLSTHQRVASTREQRRKAQRAQRAVQRAARPTVTGHVTNKETGYCLMCKTVCGQ